MFATEVGETVKIAVLPLLLPAPVLFGPVVRNKIFQQNAQLASLRAAMLLWASQRANETTLRCWVLVGLGAFVFCLLGVFLRQVGVNLLELLE